MPSINKSDYWKDRAGVTGKGDLFRGNAEAYRNAPYWKRSFCCNANVLLVDNTGDEPIYKCTKCLKKCQPKKQI